LISGWWIAVGGWEGKEQSAESMEGKGWPAPGCLAVGLALRANLGVRRWANSGWGKALPCTPDAEGAAKPRPYL